jgi:heme/copper-type cytochrome/quinol oxidase subunit 3
MSSEVQHAVDHGHGDIHLPPPSWGPIVLGLGATLAGSGLVFLPLLPVGLVVLLIGIWKVGRFTILEELRPSMNVNSRILGMWVFLASEIMFFSGLIATFLGYKSRGGEALELLNVPLMTVGTFVLLTSSFAAVSALSALQRNKTTAFRNWIIVTMVLGALFLGIELTEWAELIGHGITTGTLFGSAFFTLTGFHGMHVLIGLVWLVFLLARSVRGTMSSGDAMGIEVFGLYWHFVDIVWIVLFTIVYLI